jgi:hypothetical protein
MTRIDRPTFQEFEQYENLFFAVLAKYDLPRRFHKAR